MTRYVKEVGLLHLLENTFNQKPANSSLNPNANSNPKLQ